MRLDYPTRLLSVTLLTAFASQLWSHEPNKEPNDAPHFDRPIAKELPIELQIEEDLNPTRSEFKIVDFAFLSSESGDRWAMVIVQNQALDSRTFTEDQLIGFFADGRHRKPIRLRERIEGSKTETIVISFGDSDTPLVQLLTRGF